jgi:hypothetical protein
VHGDICTAFLATEAHDQRPSKYRARINEQIWNPGVLESLDFSQGRIHTYIVDSNKLFIM